MRLDLLVLALIRVSDELLALIRQRSVLVDKSDSRRIMLMLMLGIKQGRDNLLVANRGKGISDCMRQKRKRKRKEN